MLMTRRLLLGLLALGVVGMHGLVTSGASATHHGWAEASSVSVVQEAPAHHEHRASPMPAEDATGSGGDSSTTLALCLALLLACGVAVLRGRDTTWVARWAAAVTDARLPRPPALRDRSPVPRYTVMRC